MAAAKKVLYQSWLKIFFQFCWVTKHQEFLKFLKFSFHLFRATVFALNVVFNLKKNTLYTLSIIVCLSIFQSSFNCKFFQSHKQFVLVFFLFPSLLLGLQYGSGSQVRVSVFVLCKT